MAELRKASVRIEYREGQVVLGVYYEDGNFTSSMTGSSFSKRGTCTAPAGTCSRASSSDSDRVASGVACDSPCAATCMRTTHFPGWSLVVGRYTTHIGRHPGAASGHRCPLGASYILDRAEAVLTPKKARLLARLLEDAAEHCEGGYG